MPINAANIMESVFNLVGLANKGLLPLVAICTDLSAQTPDKAQIDTCIVGFHGIERQATIGILSSVISEGKKKYNLRHHIVPDIEKGLMESIKTIMYIGNYKGILPFIMIMVNPEDLRKKEEEIRLKCWAVKGMDLKTAKYIISETISRIDPDPIDN